MRPSFGTEKINANQGAKMKPVRNEHTRMTISFVANSIAKVVTAISILELNSQDL